MSDSRSSPQGRHRSERGQPCFFRALPGEAALDRLQSTTVLTSIRQPTARRRHCFSWINGWKEMADVHGKPRGLELILPDWFYTGVLSGALVLTIDRRYFDLTGGLERWLYRLVRKHGGRQGGGPSFDVVHLYAKSGSLSPIKHFAYDLRQIVRRQTLPGYELVITQDPNGAERLNFAPTVLDPFHEQVIGPSTPEAATQQLGGSCERPHDS